jgi:hypothetical protein
MEIKIRHTGDIRYWENIPVTMHTRKLTDGETHVLLLKLKEFCQSEFVTAIRWNDEDNRQGHYFENLSFYSRKSDGTFFRALMTGN